MSEQDLIDRIEALESRVDELEKVPPRWVMDRAKCTVRGIFEELKDLATQDIADMNEAVKKPAPHIEFVPVPNETGISTLQVLRKVESYNFPSELFTIVCNEISSPPDHVFIGEWYSMSLREGKGLRIEPSWNPENAQCQLSIKHSDGREYSVNHDDLWKVVHDFLEPFFPGK